MPAVSGGRDTQNSPIRMACEPAPLGPADQGHDGPEESNRGAVLCTGSCVDVLGGSSAAAVRKHHLEPQGPALSPMRNRGACSDLSFGRVVAALRGCAGPEDVLSGTVVGADAFSDVRDALAEMLVAFPPARAGLGIRVERAVEAAPPQMLEFAQLQCGCALPPTSMVGPPRLSALKAAVAAGQFHIPELQCLQTAALAGQVLCPPLSDVNVALADRVIDAVRTGRPWPGIALLCFGRQQRGRGGSFQQEGTFLWSLLRFDPRLHRMGISRALGRTLTPDIVEHMCHFIDAALARPLYAVVMVELRGDPAVVAHAAARGVSRHMLGLGENRPRPRLQYEVIVHRALREFQFLECLSALRVSPPAEGSSRPRIFCLRSRRERDGYLRDTEDSDQVEYNIRQFMHRRGSFAGRRQHESSRDTSAPLLKAFLDVGPVWCRNTRGGWEWCWARCEEP